MSPEQLKDPKYNLEIGDDEKPNLSLILRHVEQAQVDAHAYLRRNINAFNYWHSRWPNQTIDGRKHAGEGEEENDCFPWEGASDSRLRTCERIVNEFLVVAEFAIDNGKIQAQTAREFSNGREVNQATRLLRWQAASDMRSNLEREIPLAMAWRHGYGCSLTEAAWDQHRRINWVELNVPDVSQIVQQRRMQQGMGVPEQLLLQLIAAINDPSQSELMVQMIQTLSPIVTKSMGRGILRDLRELRYAQIPIPQVIISRPRVTALRAMVDVIFHADMDDPQSPDTRWIDRIEFASETELTDRIVTDGYDADFVEQAIQHKGEISNEAWARWVAWERERWTGAGYDSAGDGLPIGTIGWPNRDNAMRDLIEIHHFRYKAHTMDTPCLYKTVFSPLLLKGKGKRPGDDELYAKHGPDESGQESFPFIGHRFERLERPLISSRGIPEIAYTWEMEEKAQVDGVIDRTAIVLQPPIIVPQNRQKVFQGRPMPGAVLGTSRPNEVSWMPSPPFDGTPIGVQERVGVRIEQHFGLFGQSVDPDLKQIRRRRLAKQVLNEFSGVLELVLEHDKRFLPDARTAEIVGTLNRPFHLDPSQIQGDHQVVATVDTGMINDDYVEKRIAAIMQAMQLNQGGTADVNKLFEIVMQTIEPDLADAIVQDQQTASQKEVDDELKAVGLAFNGIDDGQIRGYPMFGNHQLRLQTLLKATLQNPNPEMIHRLGGSPDTVQILQNRAKFFQNQIQQRTQNPQIGRGLITSTFQPQTAPTLTNTTTQ